MQTTNLDLARQYLRAIEERVGADELAGFFSPNVIQKEFSDPAGAERSNEAPE